MGRIRTLKPEFFRSRSLAKCSLAAVLTFEGLWTEADDFGNGIADVDLLKGSLWPKRREITPDDVEGHLSELVETEHVVLYEVGGERYYSIVRWKEHQAAAYRRGTAQYPPPPDAPVEVQPVQPLHDTECKEMQLARLSVLEGNEEGNEEGKPLASTSSNAKRAPDIVWDAVLEVCGIDAKAATKRERGAWNGACGDLKRAGATPDEIRRRGAAYRARWPGASLTPTALARRWSECVATDQPANGHKQTGHDRTMTRLAQRAAQLK